MIDKQIFMKILKNGLDGVEYSFHIVKKFG